MANKAYFDTFSVEFANACNAKNMIKKIQWDLIWFDL